MLCRSAKGSDRLHCQTRCWRRLIERFGVARMSMELLAATRHTPDDHHTTTRPRRTIEVNEPSLNNWRPMADIPPRRATLVRQTRLAAHLPDEVATHCTNAPCRRHRLPWVPQQTLLACSAGSKRQQLLLTAATSNELAHGGGETRAHLRDLHLCRNSDNGPLSLNISLA